MPIIDDTVKAELEKKIEELKKRIEALEKPKSAK